MPELPEVEIMRRYFEESALDKIITKLDFLDELGKVYKSSPEIIEKSLLGKQFKSTERIGKYLFARISKGPWLHLHFGMTGNLELFQGDNLPKYARLVFHFENGEKLAFCDLRKFGVVEIVENPQAYQKAAKIGDDFLTISCEYFIEKLSKTTVAIKTSLLNQKFFAGIGNWIADEMLFDAAVHPLRSTQDINQSELTKLYTAGQKIIRQAIAEDTHYGDFPADFFVNYRKIDAIHPAYPNSPIERLVVGGRGTFIVPEKQIL
ncbi:MAG: formamidopyrimidine-DNA glycosylase [Roseivirga sp.]|jgi:formamidopyrimidine-DNA glycosylase